MNLNFEADAINRMPRTIKTTQHCLRLKASEVFDFNARECTKH